MVVTLHDTAIRNTSFCHVLYRRIVGRVGCLHRQIQEQGLISVVILYNFQSFGLVNIHRVDALKVSKDVVLQPLIGVAAFHEVRVASYVM